MSTDSYSNAGDIVGCTRSEISERLFLLDGNKFSLLHYPMYYAVYDGNFKKRLLKTCRQVAKSTTLSNFIISNSVSRPFWKTLYFSPTQEQTNKFSNLRVGKTINYSPMVKKYWMATNSVDRVLSRLYSNGSENAFSYAAEDADRIRGISADEMMADEIQDMVLKTVLEVARETMSASDHQFEFLCGTPKTLDNGIEHEWQHSSMSEWAMKCEGCNTYNYIDHERSFGKRGPICTKCGKGLNPREGIWIDLNSDYDLKGFHISQAIMPRNIPGCWPTSDERYEIAENRWKEILHKMNTYSLSKFRNEVVGVSDSQGTRLVTMDSLKEMMTGPYDNVMLKPDHNYMRGIIKIGAGIDWSGGGGDGTSRTVLWIWGLQSDRRLRTLYFRIYPGNHPIEELGMVNEALSYYRPEVTICDAGEGNVNTDWLRQKRNEYHRIMKVRYCDGDANISWNDRSGTFMINRTQAIDSFMSALLRKETVFPKNNFELMERPFKDILAEFVEVTKKGRKLWNHNPMEPDDAMHAMIFARLAVQVSTGEINLTGVASNSKG